MSTDPDPPALEAALPLLAFAGFASLFAMRMCDAMLPALSAGFGVPPAQASVAVSGFAIAYGLMQLVAGPLGDRFSKPRVVAAAAALCALSAFAAALAPGLTALAVGRVAMGATAAGIIPLTIAWIGDGVPWERRQVVLARLLGYTVVGMMAGTWAGGAIAEQLGWRWAFVLVGALLAFAALGIFRRGLAATPQAAPKGSHASRVAAILATPAARRLYAVTFAEGALVFGVVAFVPSVLHQRFGLPLTQAGAVLALFGAGGFVYARSAAWLLRRLAPSHLAAAGGGLLCATFTGLAVAPHWVWSLPACALAGIGYYFLHGCLQTQATQVSAAARGTAVSLFACVLFIGQSAGVAAMAAVVGRGAAAAGLVAGGLGLLALGAVVAGQLKRAAQEPPAAR